MLLPFRVDREVRLTPWANYALIVANVLFFAVQQRVEGVEAALLLRPHEVSLQGLIGSAFLHADLWHLGGNMLFLWLFGNAVCDKLGNPGYLAFYFSGAIAAGLAHVSLENNPALGASGAVFAVAGAFVVLFPRSRVSLLVAFLVITVVHLPSLWFVAALFVLDLLRFVGASFFGGYTSVAVLAHIGGTLFGAAVGLALMATNLVPRDQMDGMALLRRWNLRRQHRSAVREWGQTHVGAYDLPTQPADPKLAEIQDRRAEINELISHDKLREAAVKYIGLMRLDPTQVLSMHTQLDVANQLAADGRHREAAAAYELFLQHYPRHDEAPRTALMLGLLYSRYLAQPDRARTHLQWAAERIRDPDEAGVARRELEALGASAAR